MVDSDMAGQNSADEAARRAAEEARRREIMEKIRQLEQEQAGCRDLKADLQRFSGVSVETADTGVFNAQGTMGTRNGKFLGVEAAAGTQIMSLDSYISELGGKIDALRTSL